MKAAPLEQKKTQYMSSKLVVCKNKLEAKTGREHTPYSCIRKVTSACTTYTIYYTPVCVGPVDMWLKSEYIIGQTNCFSVLFCPVPQIHLLKMRFFIYSGFNYSDLWITILRLKSIYNQRSIYKCDVDTCGVLTAAVLSSSVTLHSFIDIHLQCPLRLTHMQLLTTNPMYET